MSAALQIEDRGHLLWWVPRGRYGRSTPIEDRPAISADRQTMHRDRVVARLRSIARFARGWDGEQAVPPSRAAIDDAIALVANSVLDLPFLVVPDADGSINLIAKGNAARVILALEGDGQVNVYVRRAGSEPDLETVEVPAFLGSGRKLDRILRTALA